MIKYNYTEDQVRDELDTVILRKYYGDHNLLGEEWFISQKVISHIKIFKTIIKHIFLYLFMDLWFYYALNFQFIDGLNIDFFYSDISVLIGDIL